MKYWCYYTDVVRYLERLEALCAPKTKAPAYLVWQDDDGPSMIAGPGIEWHRGDGPPPDIDAITRRAGSAMDGSAMPPDVAHGSAVPPRACGAWSGENHSTVLEDLLLDGMARVLEHFQSSHNP